MHARRALALAVAALAAACTTDMNVTVSRTDAASRVLAAGPHCEPVRLSGAEAERRGCLRIGGAFVGDTGRSWQCTRERVMGDLGSVACSLGADAMAVEPVGGSGCYQARADYFACDDPES